MKLNVRTQTAQNQHDNSPIVLVHGLFGNPDDLGVLARSLVNDHNITQVDMCNHSLSPRDPVMNYPAIAQGLVDTLDTQQIDKATFTGHSMGDEAVMALTTLASDRIDKLVTTDITPIDYHVRRHDRASAATNTVSESDTQTRQQAATIVRQHLNEEGMVQLLLKSFVNGEWRFSVSILRDQYPYIVSWERIPAWDRPALFIPDDNSPYVNGQYHNDLLAQFPQARTRAITGVGHWTHARKPDAVLCAIRRYLND